MPAGCKWVYVNRGSGTRAAVSTSTRAAPAPRRARAQALAVAPEVMTSSISNTESPSNIGRRTRITSCTSWRRASKPSGPRGTVARMRIKPSGVTRLPVIRPRDCASNADWLNRRWRRREICNGTGTRISARASKPAPALAISNARSPARSVRSAYLKRRIKCLEAASYRKAARALANAGGAVSQLAHIPLCPPVSPNGNGTPQLAQNGLDMKLTRRKQARQNCPSCATGVSQARHCGGNSVSSTARPIGFSIAAKVMKWSKR